MQNFAPLKYHLINPSSQLGLARIGVHYENSFETVGYSGLIFFVLILINILLTQ